MFRHVWLLVAAGLCLGLEGCSNEVPRTVAAVGQTTAAAPTHAPPVSKVPSRQATVSRQATGPTREKSPFIVLAGGDGLADDRLVADLATALERNHLHLRLERSKGPERDLLTLLNNPDIDVALIPTDAIESLPRRVRAGAHERLRYLFRVPSQRLHILARIDITNIYDLNGRKIDIGQPCSGSYLTARLIFDKLGIKPEFTTSDQATAFQHLRSNTIQGMVLLTSETSKEVLAFEPGGAYHLVPISFETIASSLEELIVHYAPSQFTAEEYPNLVDHGHPTDTIAVVVCLHSAIGQRETLITSVSLISTRLFRPICLKGFRCQPATEPIRPSRRLVGNVSGRPRSCSRAEPNRLKSIVRLRSLRGHKAIVPCRTQQRASACTTTFWRGGRPTDKIRDPLVLV